MKLVSFVLPRAEAPETRRIGAVTGDGNILDLASAYADRLRRIEGNEHAGEVAGVLLPSDMVEFLKGGETSRTAAEVAIDYFQESSSEQPPGRADVGGFVHLAADVKLLAPVPRPPSIRDTMSFEKHMKSLESKTGNPIPEIWYQRAIYYKGNPASVVGSGEAIRWPSFTEKLDYELEFGVYIGKQGRNIVAEEADAHIAGYTIFNDFSARDILMEEFSALLGPAKGKDFDTGNVMGPWLVTPDELNVGNLNMTARVNGDTWSEGSSSDMVWTFGQIVSQISQSETLYPGDFIGSGTVGGGCGAELDRWIQPGDVVELEVEGLGVLRNQILGPECEA